MLLCGDQTGMVLRAWPLPELRATHAQAPSQPLKVNHWGPPDFLHPILMQDLSHKHLYMFNWLRWDPSKESRGQGAPSLPAGSFQPSSLELPMEPHTGTHTGKAGAPRHQLHRMEGALENTIDMMSQPYYLLAGHLTFLNLNFLMIKWGQVISH